MNEKIEAIKTELELYMQVSLAKQHTNEYIVYTFYTNVKRKTVIRQRKEHYKDRELNNPGKSKKTNVDIPIDKFLDNIVYDLLNRGYELEKWD